MKKRFLMATMAGIMTISVGVGLAGCGNANTAETSTTEAISEGSVSDGALDESDVTEQPKIGMLAYIGEFEEPGNGPEGEPPEGAPTEGEAPSDMPEGAPAEGEAPPDMDEIPDMGEKPELDITYYNSLNEMQLALKSGDITEIMVPECVADYMVSVNDELAINDLEAAGDSEEVPDAAEAKPLTNTFSLLLMKDNKDLRDELDDALLSLYEDGTIEQLKSDYIDNVSASPEAVEPEKTDYDRVLTVAVTGNLSPMDYINDAGEPAGFNTAIIAKLSDEMGVGFEFITIDSGARATALKSGKADIVFYASSLNIKGYDPFTDGVDAEKLSEFNRLDEGYRGEDIPEDTIVSIPYYIDSYASVKLAE